MSNRYFSRPVYLWVIHTSMNTASTHPKRRLVKQFVNCLPNNPTLPSYNAFSKFKTL